MNKLERLIGGSVKYKTGCKSYVRLAKKLTEASANTNPLGVGITSFIPQMEQLDKELDNITSVYGFDITVSSKELESDLYDYLLEKRFKNEQEKYQNDADMRREYFENMYGDIEYAIDELGVGEEMDAETFLNTIGKDYFDDYAENELQSFKENNQFDEDVMREADEKIWDAREKFMEPRIALIQSIFNQNGFGLDVDSSRISDSTYFTLSKDFGDDIFYGEKVRWSDHSDHYGSKYHIWFDEKLTEIVPKMLEWWGADYAEYLKTHKPITEAKAPQPALIAQNHLGNPIAKDEESLKRFWKWFGKSATVDQKGRPFVFYHGSGYTFNSFKAHQIIGQFEDDKVVFFSTSKKFAEEFTDKREAYAVALKDGEIDSDVIGYNMPDEDDDYSKEGHLYECYLRVMNPFNPKNNNHVNLVLQWIKRNVSPELLKQYDINLDLAKSKLSGAYLRNYTENLDSLDVWDIVKIASYANTKPVEVISKNQNPNEQVWEDIYEYRNMIRRYAQIFYKGKKSVLAYTFKPADKNALNEIINSLSKGGKFKIDFKVTPTMIAERLLRSGVKFNDSAYKDVPAVFPAEIRWGDDFKRAELINVPVNITVWTITEKDNARSATYNDTWEEMERFVIGDKISFVGILKSLGFDSFYLYEDGTLNIAIFDPENIKSVDNIGKWERGKNIYESFNKVLNERLIGDAGSSKLIDEPDYNKAVEKLIAAYNSGETDCYIKTDIEFQDVHEISTNPHEINVPDEQRQHKSRKLTIILGLDDIQAKDEARKVAELLKKDFDENKEYDGSGIRHIEPHMVSIRDYLESLPDEEKEAIGYETLKSKERGLMLAWLKSLPNFFKKELTQYKERTSYKQKTIFVYGSFILVVGLEDKPSDLFKAVRKEHLNDFNYIVTFYKATPSYIDKIVALHEKYMDYKLAVEQGAIQPDVERKFTHLSRLIKKQVGVQTVVLKRRIIK